MFDTHTHTNTSHDSTQSIDELCLTAIEKGVKAISVTNHIDVYAYSEERNTEVIYKTDSEVLHAKSTYQGKLKVLVGTEIGEAHFNPELSRKLCKLVPLDVILGSVHSFPIGNEKSHFSRAILDESFPIEKIIEQLKLYYIELLSTAQAADIDVLCHLTYPMRYINGVYNRGVDIGICSDTIESILHTIIKRNIALEINTSNVGTDYNYTFPTFDIVEQYRNMGGKLITIGSDAHTPSRVANGFEYVKSKLKELGYNEYFYYEQRKPISVSI